MTTRIAATYPASDGSCPESIEIAWEDDHRQPTIGELVSLVGALGRVPRGRLAFGVGDDVERLLAASTTADDR